MTTLEDIRQKRLAQLQAQQEEETQVAQQIQALENIVKPLMTKEALARYSNIKTAHPEKSIHVLVVLGQAAQAGKISQIDDEQLKKILIKLTPQKRDFKITRR